MPFFSMFLTFEIALDHYSRLVLNICCHLNIFQKVYFLRIVKDRGERNEEKENKNCVFADILSNYFSFYKSDACLCRRTNRQL